MRERDYISYYRPLSLVQRDGYSTLGRSSFSRDEYAYRSPSSPDEQMDEYATDFETEDVRPSTDRLQRPRRSLRVVEGERGSSRSSSRSERRTRSERPASRRRGSNRRQELADEVSRNGRSDRALRPRRGAWSHEDDFDDYYATYDEEYATYEGIANGYESYGEYFDEGDDYGVREPRRAGSRSRSTDERGHNAGRTANRDRGYGDDRGRDRSRSRGYDDAHERAHDRRGARTYDHDRSRSRAASFSPLALLAFPVKFVCGLAVSHVRTCAFALSIALASFMLFAPVRDLYIAHRQLEDLQATYAALEAENQVIRDEINVLLTDEGIENEARESGFVGVGETKVIVEGLSVADEQDPTSELAPTEATDDRPWYVRFFDRIFGYKVGE